MISMWLLAEALIFAFICKTCYNIWFHPLRKFPGPKLAAGSRLWYSLRVFSGHHKYSIKSLHDRYGLVVRIAPNELSYIDPRAYEDIYGRLAHEGGSTGLQKEPDFFGPIFNDSDSIVDASSEGVKAQKNNATRAFSQGTLLGRGNVFATCTDRCIERLRANLDEEKMSTIAIDPWMGNLVLDTQAKLTTSRDLNAMEMDSVTHPIVSRMHATAATLQHTTQLQYMPGVMSIVNMILPRLDLFSVLGNFPPLGPALAARLASEPKEGTEQDFVSHMLQASKDYTPDLANVRKNSTIFTLSAVQVMPGYLCSALYYLLETPEYYHRASQEVRAVDRSEDITLGRAQNMEFLNACMREALRVSPPFLGTLPRRVPAGGATLCGEYVPGGTTVGIHNWSITHSGEFWTDADDFRPERWLGDPRYANDYKSVFHPFGVGPRTCVARNLVGLEGAFIIAKLLFAFDMVVDRSTCGEWPTHKSGHAVPNRGSLRIGMKPRSAKEG